MSEQTSGTTATEETTNEQKGGEGKEFQAITSQEDFDKAIQARIARERAKYTDYDELQAKAAKLAEIEESQKTEEQKRQERDAERDRELAELRAEKLRAEVAAAKSDPAKGIVVPVDLLTGSTREQLEASADALIKFKGEGAQKQRFTVPNLGDRPNSAGLDEADREFLGQLFQKAD